jgi:hypothetical protein
MVGVYGNQQGYDTGFHMGNQNMQNTGQYAGNQMGQYVGIRGVRMLVIRQWVIRFGMWQLQLLGIWEM